MSLPKPEPFTPPCGASDAMGRWSFTQVTPDVERLAHAQGARDIRGPDRRCEAVGAVAVRAVGRELPGAKLTLRFTGDEDDAVAALTEVLVGELVADRWLREA